MTEVQEIELNMLKQVLGICDELGLVYYMVCGSVIGAVKYKGFVPWDDDIDIALPRRDYEIFCENAQKMLPEYYFLQNYKTDPAFPTIYSKLRDSRTAFIETPTADLPINHGIYIDIFPLDGYPSDHGMIKRFEKKKKLLKLLMISSCKNNNEQKAFTKALLSVFRLFGFHRKTNATAEKLTNYLSRWQLEKSEIWCNHGNWQGKLEYAPREQYGDGVWAEFEGLRVRIPEKYDEYLTQKYGDWRAELPKEKQVSHHVYEVCDTQKSYTEYIKQEYKSAKRFI